MSSRARGRGTIRAKACGASHDSRYVRGPDESRVRAGGCAPFAQSGRIPEGGDLMAKMTTASHLTEVMTVLRRVEAQTEYDEPGAHWEEGDMLLAEVTVQSAAERMRGEQVTAEKRARITARYPLSISAKDRIRHEATGEVYEVHGPVATSYRNRMIEMVCTSAEVMP